MQPAELLQNFRVIRISVKDSSVGSLRGVVLAQMFALDKGQVSISGTYIFLLLVNMSDLKPDIFLSQWPWRIGHDIFKALQQR